MCDVFFFFISSIYLSILLFFYFSCVSLFSHRFFSFLFDLQQLLLLHFSSLLSYPQSLYSLSPLNSPHLSISLYATCLNLSFMYFLSSISSTLKNFLLYILLFLFSILLQSLSFISSFLYSLSYFTSVKNLCFLIFSFLVLLHEFHST